MYRRVYILIAVFCCLFEAGTAVGQTSSAFQAYDNYDLTGSNVRSLSGVDLQGCSAACQTEGQCKAFSFDKWKRQCSLKAKIGLMRFEPSSVSGISGALPQTSSAPWELRRIRGQTFTANRFRSETLQSYGECEHSCEIEQDCIGVSYAVQNQNCKMFQSIDGYSADQNTDSGYKRQVQETQATARLLHFQADLKGSREVPLNDTKGTGKLTATYDPVTKELAWSGSFSGLTGPALVAHFHGPATFDKNAGVALSIWGVNAPRSSSDTFEGSATLTDAQAVDLLNNQWYVNIHTDLNKGGELRGQLERFYPAKTGAR